MPEVARSSEKVLEKLREDLRFCEECLRREVRIELVMKILDEIIHYAEGLLERELPENLREEVKSMASRAKLLYHRAVALNALKEREAARG